MFFFSQLGWRTVNTTCEKQTSVASEALCWLVGRVESYYRAVNADWVPPTAIVVTGVSTAVLAVATWRLVNKTNALVGENTRLIAAAEKEANASLATVEEIKRDRELGYRPYLSWTFTEFRETEYPPEAGYSDTLRVLNLGRGPAINAVYAMRFVSTWRRSPTFDSPVGDDGEVKSYGQAGQRPPEEFLGYQDEGGRWEAMFCEDPLGNIYRFRPLTKPDIWSAEKTDLPGWVGWYRAEKVRLIR